MWADWIPGILMLVLFALETPIAFAIAIAAHEVMTAANAGL